jgi:small GTP-binding protein
LVLFNYALKELTAKIVYYGPGLSGKTSNLQYIYEELPIKNKGRMLTLATETDRTLYFDFLPVDAGVVRGIKTRVQLYTVPGQVFYNATRRMVLKGADGVVFVADSQKSMQEANVESLENLRDNLKAHDLKLEEMPLVMQFNKRDLKDIAALEEMSELLNKMNAPFYEAVAKDGIGVEETLQAISGLVLKSVIDRYGGDRMTPMGTPIARAASDPARTDPDALVPAAAEIGKKEKEAVSASLPRASSGGGAGRKDVPARAPSWPSAEAPSVSSDDDLNPLDSFESLNIEGILDEALKLDDAEEEPVPAPSPAPKPQARAAPSKPRLPEPMKAAEPAEEESMFSGLLEEALGDAREAESILDSVLHPEPAAPSPPQNDPMSEIEVELLGEGLEPVDEEEGARPSLSELIKTRVSIPAERLQPPTPAKPSAAPPVKTRGPIEVPVDVEIESSAFEGDIELLLRIRIKRK